MSYNNICYIANHNNTTRTIISALTALGAQEMSANHNPDVIIVVGGDGTMLHTIHKYMSLNIPFYGINAGHIGFLMNKPTANALRSSLDDSKIVTIHPLEMQVHTVNNAQIVALAVNEVSLLRQTHQSAKLKIMINGQTQMPELVSDGVLVSTPAGSTAYNLSAGGPILPIGSNLLALTPISPFRPRRWHGALISKNAEVSIEVIDQEIRPVSAVADFFEVRDISKVTIREKSNIAINLLFNKDQSLEDRVINEQFTNF